MTTFQKKAVTAVSLFIASVLSVVLLGYGSAGERLYKEDIIRIDSVLLKELAEFTIRKNQIASKKIYIGDFERIHYTVRVPKGISKTLIQTDLHYKMSEMDVQVPGKLVLPQKDLRLFFYTNGTVIRSMEIKTDTSLTLQTFQASLFFITDESVSVQVLESARDLGEYSPLIYRSLNPSDVQRWYKKQEGILSPVFVWMNDSQDQTQIKNSIWLKDKLLQFSSISSRIKLLVDQESASSDTQAAELFRTHNVESFSFKKVIELDAEKGLYETHQQLERLVQEAKKGISPYLFVRLNSKTLNTFKEETYRLKKRGLRFVKASF